MTGESTGTPRRSRRRIDRGVVAGVVAAVVVLGALVGCSSKPDPAQDANRPSSAGDAAPQGGQAQAAYAPPREVPGADQPFPNLADVPERPVVSTAEQRAKLEQGLVADRARRQYSGEVIVLQGPVLETPAATAAPPPPPSLADAASASARADNGAVTLPSASVPALAPSTDVPQSSDVAAAPAAPPTSSLTPSEAPPPVPTLSAAEAPATGQRPDDTALPTPAEQFLRAARETSEEAAASVQGAEPIASITFRDGGTRLTEGDEATLRDVAARYRQSGGSVRVVGRGGPGGSGEARARATAVADALAGLGVPEDRISITAEDAAGSTAAGAGAAGRADIFLAR